jgi:hypothetical protein
VTVEKQTAAAQQQRATVEALALERHVVATVHESELRHPDGSVRRDVVRKLETSAATKHERAATEVKTEIKYVERIQKEIVERETERNWALGIGAGLRAGPRAIYQAQVSRRIVGPFEAGIWADTTKAAGIMIGVRW